MKCGLLMPFLLLASTGTYAQPSIQIGPVGFSTTLALSFGKSGLCGRKVAAGSPSSEGSMKRVGGRHVASASVMTKRRNRTPLLDRQNVPTAGPVSTGLVDNYLSHRTGQNSRSYLELSARFAKEQGRGTHRRVKLTLDQGRSTTKVSHLR